MNLLLVFRVLMEEGSVNRAAEQLGRTPSAVSHALGRLREQLDDPLLVRTGGIMKPSPRAEALYDEVRPILSQIERIVQPQAAFEPNTSNRIFKIAGPALDLISSKIVALMHAKAPDTGLAWQPYSKETMVQITSGDVDMAFGNANFPLPEGLKAQSFKPLKRYVLGRRGHPAANDWNTESWMRWPHIVVRIPAAIHGTVDERLANLGLKRRIGLHAAAWSGIASALNSTNMLGNFPAICMVESAIGKELQLFEPPEPMPPLQFRLIWKAELDADPAISWLRGIVLKAFDELYSEADRLISDTDIIMPRSLT
ncbi:MAG: LysR family transcriptional regulator [Hyphomicrobiales bacterium]